MIMSSLMISQDVNRGEKKQIILFPLFVFTFFRPPQTAQDQEDD